MASSVFKSEDTNRSQSDGVQPYFLSLNTAHFLDVEIIGEFDHHQTQSIFETSDLQARQVHAHEFCR